jgi:hypothetical protein
MSKLLLCRLLLLPLLLLLLLLHAAGTWSPVEGYCVPYTNPDCSNGYPNIPTPQAPADANAACVVLAAMM